MAAEGFGRFAGRASAEKGIQHHVAGAAGGEQNAVEQCLLSLLYGVKLVHLSPWDTFWGQDNRGKGTNVYGKLLMRLSSLFSRTSFPAKVEREAQYMLHTLRKENEKL